MKHIHIVGGPASGKTTLARKIAKQYGLGYIELDALFWKADWQMSSTEEFITNIQDAMDKHPQGWVLDGSYTGLVGDFIEPKIDTFIYLQIPPYKTIPRTLTRSMKRAITKELLWGINEEKLVNTMKLAFYAGKTYHERKRRMRKLNAQEKPYTMYIFRSNKQANNWIDALL